MANTLRLTEKWMHRGLWLVAFVFAGFLIVNANAVDFDEARVIGMKNNVPVPGPISISRARQQLAGDGKCGGARDPVTFLHATAR